MAARECGRRNCADARFRAFSERASEGERAGGEETKGQGAGEGGAGSRQRKRARGRRASEREIE